MKELMILVERAVRPVRASHRRKQRMREELLTHVSEIYGQEMARFGSHEAALAESSRRFGEPTELSRDLQASVGFNERCAFAFERWFAWQAGESALRYTLRLSVLHLLIGLVSCAAIVGVVTVLDGPFDHLLVALRPGLAFIIVCCVDLLVLGLLHFKIRDALVGAPWARRSWPRAAAYGLLFAAVVYASPFLFAIAAGVAAPFVLELFDPVLLGIVALLSALLVGVIGWIYGLSQIRHVEWVSLDI